MGRTRPPTPGRLDARRLKRLGRRLALGEQVLAAADATTHGRRGVLAATNRRLLFVRRGALRRRDESFPYGELRGVRSAPGFLTVDLEQGRARSFSLPRADSASEIGAFAHARIDVTGSHVTRLLADLEALARDRQLEERARLEPAYDLADLEPPTAEVDGLAWRHERLIAAGYEAEDAATLTGSDVNLAQACALLERGCAPALAMRILL